eukprot:471865-Pelagomonas_calceolata.AAC.3
MMINFALQFNCCNWVPYTAAREHCVMIHVPGGIHSSSWCERHSIRPGKSCIMAEPWWFCLVAGLTAKGYDTI